MYLVRKNTYHSLHFYKLFLQMRDLRHMNINPFVGACVDQRMFIIVTEYCFKGSLQVSAMLLIWYLSFILEFSLYRRSLRLTSFK